VTDEGLRHWSRADRTALEATVRHLVYAASFLLLFFNVFSRILSSIALLFEFPAQAPCIVIICTMYVSPTHGENRILSHSCLAMIVLQCRVF